MAWKEVSRDEFTTFVASYGTLLELSRAGTMGKMVTIVDQANENTPIARSDGARFWLHSDDEPADVATREEMIRNDAFGDIANMGKPR